MEKLLGVFDFDFTIISENSDTVARDLLPPEVIKAQLETCYSKTGWTAYMDKSFELLFQEGITLETIREAVISIPPVPDFVQFFKDLNKLDCEIIVISDSNTYFIQEWLKRHGLQDVVKAIYSNPASISGNRLSIEKYHVQDWCKLSTENLCKGHILLKHIENSESNGVKYNRTFYVGDGHNDLCPSLKLTENDYIFPRQGFPLAKELSAYATKIRAKVIPWENTSQIWSVLQQI